MPYEIKFDNTPAGYTVSASGPDEKTVLVVPTEFTSTEDGQYFIKRLEGYPQDILKKIEELGTYISPSKINHMLAVIQSDGSATVYVNELHLSVAVRVARKFKEGESVFKNDIVDVQSAHLAGIEIPIDAGILFLFSAGWRKGLFFDFRPLKPYCQKTEYNFEAIFRQFYTHVMFQERFSILEEDWIRLFAAGWFLFNSLTVNNIQNILKYVQHGWNQTKLLEEITDNIIDRIDHFRNCWQQQDMFNDHSKLLIHALDRFLENDYISCVSILYPRIEGLLRSNYRSINSDNKTTQKNLSEAAITNYAMNSYCLLLPRRFQQFLETVYFGSFDPANSDIKCSRNSVGHGVASQEDFNQQSALVAIMVVQQLCYFFTVHSASASGKSL